MVAFWDTYVDLSHRITTRYYGIIRHASTGSRVHRNKNARSSFYFFDRVLFQQILHQLGVESGFYIWVRHESLGLRQKGFAFVLHDLFQLVVLFFILPVWNVSHLVFTSGFQSLFYAIFANQTVPYGFKHGLSIVVFQVDHLRPKTKRIVQCRNTYKGNTRPGQRGKHNLVQ